MPTTVDRPAASTVEVSLFGPGVGECVVVHLGEGEWIIVDSCHDQTGANSALAYLASISVDSATDVKLVVATHAHDDHIRGIAEIVEAAPSADFVCPDAATREEFLALLEVEGELWPVRPRAYEEFSRVFDTLELRRSATGRPLLRRAVEGRPLLPTRPPGAIPAAVVALSPSDDAVTRAVAEFAAMFPAAGDHPRRSGGDPNTFACALWVEAGSARVLLGSDLLIGPGPTCGWNAVLASPFRPQGVASLFKVAHHGSPNADHAGIWSDMLVDEPTAILTPFRAGRTKRPAPEDIARICGRTRHAFLTSSATVPAQPEVVRRDGRKLQRLATNVRRRRDLMGHIRARVDASANGPWEIALFGPAASMCP